ncbi:MAG: ATP-binding cassette domain-containing protein [Caldilineales bacterium]|nr:ATP-binding cassette domain-containing protein [Caldilineales bacterium]
MPAIVTVENLSKQYNPPDGELAVKEVSFEIAQGEIFSLLGPNGAGKTTTISMLSCLLAPTGGRATVAGHSIIAQLLQVKQAIGVVPQEIALYPSISASENLHFWGQMYGLGGARLRERVAAVLEIAGLSDRAKDKVETYSGGMKRRLNIAVGLLHEPQILYLDEPTVGIDPQSRRRILDTIKQLNEQGMTVLYTTHYMEEAEELSDRIGIIDHGELIAIGTLAELNRMVGECDIIRLEVDLNGAAVEDLIKRLGECDGVSKAAAEDGRLMLQVAEADTALAEIVVAVNESGAHIRQLEIQEPNLEAVFLHLTGRALRD